MPKLLYALKICRGPHLFEGQAFAEGDEALGAEEVDIGFGDGRGVGFVELVDAETCCSANDGEGREGKGQGRTIGPS